jgi:hypothetical protein
MDENSPLYIRELKEGNCPQYLFLIWKIRSKKALKKSRSDYNSRLGANGINWQLFAELSTPFASDASGPAWYKASENRVLPKSLIKFRVSPLSQTCHFRGLLASQSCDRVYCVQLGLCFEGHIASVAILMIHALD